jgi:hypothetical protein
MLEPVLEFLCEIRCELAPPLEFGPTYSGFRRVVDIRGGVFAGASLRGTVRGGADWQVTRNDGVVELQARYVLLTDDGVPIQVRNRGLRHGPEEVLRRIAEGEAVDAQEYYCRTTPVFDAPQGKYEWLNRSVFVATAERSASFIRLHVYRVA